MDTENIELALGTLGVFMLLYWWIASRNDEKR
jgi:hypothetical protein